MSIVADFPVAGKVFRLLVSESLTSGSALIANQSVAPAYKQRCLRREPPNFWHSARRYSWLCRRGGLVRCSMDSCLRSFIPQVGRKRVRTRGIQRKRVRLRLARPLLAPHPPAVITGLSRSQHHAVVARTSWMLRVARRSLLPRDAIRTA